MKILKVSLLIIPSLCNAGQFLDLPDIGKSSYLNARYLSHATGRFITQDLKKQYFGEYNYGNGRVIKGSDPSGEMWESGIVYDLVDLGNEVGSAATTEEITPLNPENTSARTKDKGRVIVAKGKPAHSTYFDMQQTELNRTQEQINRERRQLDLRQDDLNDHQRKIDMGRHEAGIQPQNMLKKVEVKQNSLLKRPTPPSRHQRGFPSRIVIDMGAPSEEELTAIRDLSKIREAIKRNNARFRGEMERLTEQNAALLQIHDPFQPFQRYTPE